MADILFEIINRFTCLVDSKPVKQEVCLKVILPSMSVLWVYLSCLKLSKELT